MMDSTNIRLDIIEDKSSDLEGIVMKAIQNEPHMVGGGTKKIERTSVSYRNSSGSLI